MGWVEEVTAQGVVWSSEEVSDLVEPQMNLVHAFENIHVSGTLKNFWFLLRSWLILWVQPCEIDTDMSECDHRKGQN
jgi:hypothetical protein